MYTVLMDNLTIHDPSLNDSAHLLFDGVVNKQVNKADSFSFTIYPDNVGYQSLELMTSWVTVYKDGDVIFHGRPLTEDTGWDNEKVIVCEGDLAVLNDTVMRPYSYSGTLSDYITMIVNQHNAQVGIDKQITVRTVDNPAETVVRRTGEYKATIQELFEKVVDYFGGYIVMEYENGTRYLSYKIDSVSGTNQTLEIGKNILDFQRSLSSEALATAVIPLGAADDATGERLTIESVNSGDDYIVSPDAVTRGLIYTLYTWDDVTDPSDLLAKAQALLTDLVRVSPRIELSAVDLSDAGYNIDSIGFFEYVTVQDTAHTVSGQYLITERTYNISAPENDTVTFGSEEKTISGQTAKTQTDLSSMTDAFINKAVEIVAYQTDLLKGGSGGYFIIGTDVDGHPSEIYFMDTDSVATARSILRINKNGIGFSTTGISGPYYNAWTIDGNLNASYITTGLLQDSAGKNSWNLDTGAFVLTDGSINITTNSEQDDKIVLNYTVTDNYGNTTEDNTSLAPRGLQTKHKFTNTAGLEQQTDVLTWSGYITGHMVEKQNGTKTQEIGYSLNHNGVGFTVYDAPNYNIVVSSMLRPEALVFMTGPTSPTDETFRLDGATGSITKVNAITGSGSLTMQSGLLRSSLTVGSNSDGTITLNNASGNTTATLDGSTGKITLGGSTNGEIIVKNSSNANRIILNGSSGNITSVTHTLGSSSLGDGTMFVNNASNNSTITLDGADGGIVLGTTGQRGRIRIYDASNNARVYANGGNGGLYCLDGSGSTKARIALLGGTGEGLFADANQDVRIKIQGADGKIISSSLELGGTSTDVSTAGNLKINRADGTNGMEFNPSLPAMIIKAANGTGYRTALADDGLYFYNASGTQTALYPSGGFTYYGGSAITSNVPSGTATNVRSVSLPAGRYIIWAEIAWPNNSTGRREACIGTYSGNVTAGAAWDFRNAVSGDGTRQSLSAYVTTSAQTTYYLVLYQNSGSTLAMSAYGLYAIKLP